MMIPVGPFRMTLAIVLIVLGVGGFTVYLVTSLMKVFSGMERIDIPGKAELNLEPGDYTIYWETRSRFSRMPSLSDLDITIVSKEGDLVLGVSSSGPLRSHYSTMEVVGESVAAISVRQEGTYKVTVAAAAGKTLPQGGIAVGRALGILGLLRLIVFCLLMLGGGLGPGVYLLVTNSKAS